MKIEKATLKLDDAYLPKYEILMSIDANGVLDHLVEESEVEIALNFYRTFNKQLQDIALQCHQ